MSSYELLSASLVKKQFTNFFTIYKREFRNRVWSTLLEGVSHPCIWHLSPILYFSDTAIMKGLEATAPTEHLDIIIITFLTKGKETRRRFYPLDLLEGL